MIVLKTAQEIEKIRKSCQLVAKVLKFLEVSTGPGITTKTLDTLAEKVAHDRGAIPAFKGYKGYPYSICASKNSEVIHGMPTDEPLQEGDILSIDFGILLGGYYGDSTITIPVGKVSKDAELLIKTGQECLYKGIEQFCEGNRLNQISHVIQNWAEFHDYSVVRDFVGHGIGKNLHEEPQLPNFTTKPKEGIRLNRGMVIAIEPMIVAGSHRLSRDINGWTHRTTDGSLAVHWEHTVAITDKGTKILSIREDEEWAEKNYS
jgi:methionyl aminopeptidase